MRVDDRRIRKEKVADSKISGYVWTGPEVRVQIFADKGRFPLSLKFYIVYVLVFGWLYGRK